VLVLVEKLLSLDPITRGAVQQQGKAVWFDSKQTLKMVKPKRSAKEQKRREKRNLLTPNEEAYLKQRVQKRKGWLPKRVRKCERIKRYFKD